MLGIPQCYGFSDMMDSIMINIVHPDYATLFGNFNSKESIVKSFDNGVTKLYIQYPAMDSDQDYSWVQNTIAWYRL